MNRVFFVDGFHTASRALRLDHKQISTSIFRIRYFQMRGAHKECTLNTINHIFKRAFGLLLIVYLMRVLLNSIYFSFFSSVVECAFALHSNVFQLWTILAMLSFHSVHFSTFLVHSSDRRRKKHQTKSH